MKDDMMESLRAEIASLDARLKSVKRWIIFAIILSGIAVLLIALMYIDFEVNVYNAIVTYVDEFLKVNDWINS